MMNDIEKRIVERIDQNREEIIAFAEDVFKNAESGFEEYATSAKIAAKLRELGITVTDGLAGTGVKAECGSPKGPSVALIGELDGIRCPEHPFANAETGVSHACGHHAQLAIVLGAAIALSDPEVTSHLDGRAVFFAVPAEEYLNEAIRSRLVAEGKTKYLSGKSELIRLGHFDDVDMAITTHAHYADDEAELLLGSRICNGFVGKLITMHGKAAHAAAAPHEGVNALSAVSIALNALGMQRETFEEKNHVRVHYIIKEGGTASNVVPDKVVVDLIVRASNQQAIIATSEKVDRIFKGAAQAFGAEVEVQSAQGFLPTIERPADQVMRDAAQLLQNEARIALTQPGQHVPVATDVGDLMHIMPVLNYTFGGTKGALHSKEFAVTDPEKAYILPAKMAALTMYRLLRSGAAQASAVMENFKPTLSKEVYIRYAEAMHCGADGESNI